MIFSNNTYFSNLRININPIDLYTIIPKYSESTYFTFDNKKLNKINISNFSTSEEFYFKNKTENIEIKSLFSGSFIYSDSTNFNNSFIEPFKQDLFFSNGILPYEDVINVISLESTTYDTLNNLIGNLNIPYYWFDNSIPSRQNILQTKLISWGYTSDITQFSLRMPAYSSNIEFDVKNIDTKYTFSTELRVYPWVDDSESLDIELNTTGTGEVLNIELNKAKAYYYPINLETHISEFGQWNSLVKLEFSKISKENIITNIELKGVNNQSYKLNIETDIQDLGYYYRNNLELNKVTNSIKPLDIEFISGFGCVINIEVLLYMTENRYLDLELSRIYNQNYYLDLEFSRIYNDDYISNLEFSIPEITRLYNLDTELRISNIPRYINLEFSRIYNDNYDISTEINVNNINTKYGLSLELPIDSIDKDYITNLEFSRIYNDNYTNNLELFIPSINTRDNLDLEFVMYTDYEKYLDLELIRSFDKQSNVQTYVIPFGFNDDLFQVKVLATSKNKLDLEFNLAYLSTSYNLDLELYTEIERNYINNFELNIPFIAKNYPIDMELKVTELNTQDNLDLETRVIYHEDLDLNLEVPVTSILTDYNTNIETKIEGINRDYPINIETLLYMTENRYLDLEVYNVINTEYNTNIEIVLDNISKLYNLDLEFFVSTVIRKVNLELFVSTVNKILNLEIDVLDLVYYVISKGYNIIPWSYSDGKGNWDNSIDKNWNKESTDNTTIVTGLLNQLQDKNIALPDNIRFSDKTQDNFGIIIPHYINSNIELSDKFLYYKSEDNYTIVMGKKKKDPLEIVNLKKGKNMIIWDGQNSDSSTFNNKIRIYINDYINYAMLWDQYNSEWKLLLEDHPLYFPIDVEGQTQFSPYILVIDVNDDCSFEIRR